MGGSSMQVLVCAAIAAAVVAVVLVRPFVGAAAEPNDTFDAATPITFNATFRDTIASAGDVDYFAFTVGAAPTQLTASLQELPANYDLQLYGPDRALIATSSRTSTLSESIGPYTAVQTGTYYLRVYSADGESSSTQYAIRVDAVEPTPTITPTPGNTSTPTQTPTVTLTPTATATSTPFDPEPNDSYTSAYQLASGQTVQGRIQASSDVDFFKVVVPNAGSTVQVTLSDLPADYDLYLDRPDQTGAATSQNTGTTPESITYESGDTTGNFFVVVLSNRGESSSAPYTLRVTVTSPPGAPAVFAVDSLGDDPDAAPGDGACRTASGACSLPAAMEEAHNLAGPQSVVLPSGRIMLVNRGVFWVQDGQEVRVYGAGQDATIVDVSGRAHRVSQGGSAIHFSASGSGVLHLQDLTLTGGDGVGSGRLNGENTGSVSLYNRGTTSLLRVGVTGNGYGAYSPPQGTVKCGRAAIWNDGTLTIDASTIANNAAGGINNRGTLTLRRSSVSGNVGSACSNLYDAGESVRSGGVVNYGGQARIEASSISGNRSGGRTGGGVFNNGGTVTMINSTAEGNAGFLDDASDLESADGTSLTHASIGTLTYGRVTIANSAIGCDARRYTRGSITSLGRNVDRDGSCGLGENTSSTAVDAADPAYCPPTDQRGVARPQGPACDIGAIEFDSDLPDATATPTPIVSATSTPSATTTHGPTGTPVPVPSPGPNRLILPVVLNSDTPS